MKVQIWLLDQGKIKESEMTGKDADVNLLVDFYFRLDHLIGFWIDPERDPINNSRDIVFYIGGDSFKTPYKKALAEKFYETIYKSNS